MTDNVPEAPEAVQADVRADAPAEQAAPPAGGPAKLDRDQRLDAYLAKLDELKQANTTLREVLEREMLLEFVRTNRTNINEFPLLETQQQSVITVLSQRGEHPAYDHIRRLTSSFITLLNQYRKLRDGNDTEELDAMRVQLTNNETLLIKTVQGVVYACGLITDNFEELVLKNLGKAALHDYSQLMQDHPLGPDFWRTALERFVTAPVEAAHMAVIRDKTYRLTKDGKNLAVQFPFDAVMDQLMPAPEGLDKTRIQTAFESNASGAEGQATLKVVFACLKKGLDFISEDVLPSDALAYNARVVCVDPNTADYRDRYLERAQVLKKGRLQSEEGKSDFDFLTEQVVATGVGAVIGSAVTRDSLIQTLRQFLPDGMEAISSLTRDFSMNSLQRLYMRLLEQKFLDILRQQTLDEQGKLQFRTRRAKRIPRDAVAKLAELNLNRIRQKKLWEDDPAGEQWLLFRARTAKQLVALMSALQLEPELIEGIRELWTGASDKVDLQALVDLAQLSRTTTNLRARLAEILAKFGIGGQAKPEPEPGAPETTETPEAPETLEASEAPQTPETPETPGTSEASEAPDTPDSAEKTD